MRGEPVTNVPYIGEKTAKTIRRKVRSFTNKGPVGDRMPTVEETLAVPEGVLQQELGTRQRKELSKYVGNRKTSLLTREEEREVQRQQSSNREKSERKGVGDFVVNRSQQKEAFEQHQDRSARAKDVDNQRRATLTTNFELWSENPGRYDYPGIDTPSRKPRVQEDDKPFVEPEDFRRETDDMGMFGTAFENKTQEQEPPEQALREQSGGRNKPVVERITPGDTIQFDRDFNTGTKTLTASVEGKGTTTRGSSLTGDKREVNVLQLQFQGENPYPDEMDEFAENDLLDSNVSIL